MRKATKRITALVLAVLLFTGITGSVFAAGSIYPQTGTRLVYRPNTGSKYGQVNIGLAAGTKSFTIKRADVKVSKGTTGAKFSYLRRETSTNKHQGESWSGSEWLTDTSSYKNISYTAGLLVNHSGTATVKYKIGTNSYSLKVQVLDYKNPVKSITLTGVKSGKNFAALTKSSMYLSKSISLPKNVSSAKLAVTAASGWKITELYIYDQTAGVSRYIQCTDGLSSMTLSCGKLLAARRYTVWVDFFNTSNGATMSIAYPITGANA